MGNEAQLILFGRSALEAWRAAALVEARFLKERDDRWACGDFSDDRLPDNAASSLLQRRRFSITQGIFATTSLPKLRFAAKTWNLTTPVQVLALGVNRRGRNALAQCHMYAPAMNGRLHVRFCDGVLVPVPELALAEYAASSQKMRVLLAACELCGLYSEDHRLGALLERPALSSLESLESLRHSLQRARGAKAYSFACSLASVRSRSPRETAVSLLLSLPYSFGGYKLPAPQLNWDAKLSLSAQKIYRGKSVECDLCWPEARVALFYESDAHHLSPHQLAKDSKRDAALVDDGWFVVRLTNQQLKSVDHMDEFAKMLGRKLGKGVRPSYADFRKRQMTLRRQLRL